MKKYVLIALLFFVIVAMSYVSIPSSKTLQFGIDVLQKNDFKVLKDAGKIGLLTHLASTNSDNIPTCDVFIEANNNKSQLNGRLVCFFSPEHGFSGEKEAGEGVDNEIYNGVSVYSLYDGDSLKIKQNCFENIDTLVIDLRDIGVRYYCYNTCMRFALEKAIREGKKVYVLDRPNPLGRKVSGLCLEEKLQAYVGGFCIPHVYGMTMGELANMVVKDYIPHPWLPKLTMEELQKAKSLLTVIPIKNWDPQKTWREQNFKKGYHWHAPSPNIPCFESAQTYSCSIAVSSYGNFTTRMHDAKSDAYVENIWIQPFVLLKLPASKFPNFDALIPLCHQLNALNLPGASFFVNREELGIDLKIENWNNFDPWHFVVHALALDRQIDKAVNETNKFEALSESGLLYDQELSDVPFSKYYNDPHRKSYWEVVRSILGNEAFIHCLSEDELTNHKINEFLKLSQDQCCAFEVKRKNWLLY